MDNEPKRQSQVNVQFDKANKSLGELTDIVGDLGEKLEMVLREPPPQSEGVQSSDEECLVPVAREIRNIATTINNLTVQLKDYLDRLEV